jgi:hypothetical protein
LASGKLQAAALTAQDPISQRVVVGAALGGEFAKVILVDPPNDPVGAIHELPLPTNLTVAMVARAARNMRRTIPLDETIFRGPGLEIRLTREEYRNDKRHGWLDVLD